MKFVLSSSALSQRLQTICRVIVAKNSSPILECVLMEISDGRLKMTASDDDIRMETYLDLNESDGDIRIAVDAKKIQEAFSQIPDQPLEIYINESTLEMTVEYLNGKFSMLAQPADNYPIPPALPETAAVITVPAEHFVNAFSRAFFATADDNVRPIMNSINVKYNPEGIDIIASDGHKLSMTTLKDGHGSETGSFIIPKRPSTLLKNLLSKETGECTINVSDKRVLVTTENFTLSTSLLDGVFPKFENVIPQNNANIVTINRQAFLGALRRVLIFAEQSGLARLQIENSKMTVTCQDIDFSMSAEETLLCDYTSMPMSIGFKGSFLVDLLSNMECEELLIKLADAGRAALFIPLTQEENEDLLMLLMPMMINN